MAPQREERSHQNTHGHGTKRKQIQGNVQVEQLCYLQESLRVSYSLLS